MKQHITIEQWNELTKQAQEELKSWYVKRDDEMEGHLEYIIFGVLAVPLLSIGQMIEFLDEYFSKKQYDFDIRIHSAGSAWKYPGQRLTDLNPPIKYEIEDEVEICDALWEAVKEVLEK